MSNAEDETAIVRHDHKGKVGPGRGNPPAALDAAVRQLRADPAAVARLGAEIEREMERRRALFDGASDDTPQR